MVTIYLTSKFSWYHEPSITRDSQHLDPAMEEGKTLLYLHDDDSTLN